MKSKSRESDKQLSKDQKTFEQLPTQTKDGLLLGDEAEKSIGKDRVKINRQINRETRPTKR